MLMRSRPLWALTLALVASCSVSQDQEVALGDQARTEIEQKLPMVHDQLVEDYVTDLGSSIASGTSRADLKWRFQVVDAADLNAFALPGGFIYVNRGLIEKMRSMDELAGVLGHEIGHVVARHSAKQMEKRTKTSVGVGIVCTVSGWCNDAVTQTAINVAGSAYFAKHSRLDEQQADSEAVVNVLRAGIDPAGIPALFEVLLSERRSRPSGVSVWFASHPLEESRVARTRELIAEIPAEQRRGLAKDSPRFQQVKARLFALPASPTPLQLPAP